MSSTLTVAASATLNGIMPTCDSLEGLAAPKYKEWRNKLDESSQRMAKRAEAYVSLRASCDEMERLRKEHQERQTVEERRTHEFAEKAEKRKKEAKEYATWRANIVLEHRYGESREEPATSKVASEAGGESPCGPTTVDSATSRDRSFCSTDTFDEGESPKSPVSTATSLWGTKGQSLRRTLLHETRRQCLERQDAVVDSPRATRIDRFSFEDDQPPEKNVLAHDFYDVTPACEASWPRYARNKSTGTTESTDCDMSPMQTQRHQSAPSIVPSREDEAPCRPSVAVDLPSIPAMDHEPSLHASPVQTARRRSAPCIVASEEQAPEEQEASSRTRVSFGLSSVLITKPTSSQRTRPEKTKSKAKHHQHEQNRADLLGGHGSMTTESPRELLQRRRLSSGDAHLS
eukprot:gnl/TRDRNA2_/TRDRNA2_172358_c0_seq16.p1 gnl/TRDRNA2_/TRDRNA2_172358_c0~~gnl/TRDRNA2_/TRDRNA2_172358_c0_seq16.p1  ORF type:complete len:403 (-),score=41.97 gnl/TRDRNA2_/TRDRNA2_172358_c0_seq16:9-1217(-)